MGFASVSTFCIKSLAHLENSCNQKFFTLDTFPNGVHALLKAIQHISPEQILDTSELRQKG